MEKTNARTRGSGKRTPSSTTADASDVDENDTVDSAAVISPLSSSTGELTAQPMNFHQNTSRNKNPTSSFSASSSLEEDSAEGRDSLPTKAQSAATQSTAATSLSSRTKASREILWEKEEERSREKQQPRTNHEDSSASSNVSNKNNNSSSGLVGYAKSYWNDLGQESASPPDTSMNQRKGSIRPPPSPRQQTNSPRKSPPPASTTPTVSAQGNNTTTPTQEEEEEQPSIFELFERRRQTRRHTQLQQQLKLHENKKKPNIQFDGSFTMEDIQPTTQLQRQQQQQQSVREGHHTGPRALSSSSGSNANGISYPPQQAKTEEDTNQEENQSREKKSFGNNTTYPPQQIKEKDVTDQQQQQQQQQQHYQTEQQQQQQQQHYQTEQQQQRDRESRRQPVRSTRLDRPASSVASPALASISSSHSPRLPQRSRSRNVPKTDSGSSAGSVLPGAYQQAPGKTITKRNRNIRNSVISTHSVSAQMSGSTTRLISGDSGRSLLSARSSGGSVSTMNTSHRSHNSIPTAERRGRRGCKKRKDDNDDDNDEDFSSVKYSSGEKRRQRRQRQRQSRKLQSSAEDFYEVIPDYAEAVQEPSGTSTTGTVSALYDERGCEIENNDDLNEEEFMYQRKLAAGMADVDVDISLEENHGNNSNRNNNDQLSQSSSTRRKHRQNDATKAPPKTSYGAATNKNGISTTGSQAGALVDTNIPKGKNMSSKSVISDDTINKKEPTVQHAYKETPPEKALDDIITAPHAPSSRNSGVRIDEGEEAKEEIEALLEEQEETVAPLQNMPWQGRSRIPLNSNPSSRSQRMQYNSIGGSNHSMNLSRLNSIAALNSRKMSYVSSGSSGELSMTEFKRRVSSMFSLSSSDEDASVACDMSMRITRNMSTYMRSGGLPVAATVVSSEDVLRNEIRQELEIEMSEMLKREIRLELEGEMAEFRRQLVHQVFSAAEPITANVISVEQNSLQNSQMASFRDAQVERERTEAAAVRSNMHREIGRLYMEMKRGQSANFSNTGNSSMYSIRPIDENEEAFYDEEMAQPHPISESKEAPTMAWRSIWFLFAFVIISGFVLGVGIGKFL